MHSTMCDMKTYFIYATNAKMKKQIYVVIFKEIDWSLVK